MATKRQLIDKLLGKKIKRVSGRSFPISFSRLRKFKKSQLSELLKGLK